ncbi:MAG: N-acetylmuramoyl-L-alanine amidase [Planctomycetes bacterium]|nr:N-acetylmuramoyl-L-alanine amidase [Planctomycetota bacterium]MCB9904152.1 N-acetylmuramoyl-L-alanine amidase [Planctomycetota bacterium]
MGPLLAAILVLATACTSPGTPRPVESTRDAGSDRDAPYWSELALSWSTLNEIEDWIHSDAARRDPYWRLQGELVLAEGRVALAREDARNGSVASSTLETRRKAARDGFQRVLDDPQSIPEQRIRARRGLSSAGEPEASPRTPLLVARNAWGAEREVASRLNPVGQKWRRITVHHSAEIPGFTLNGHYDNSVAALRKIQRYHIHENGWGDIGYHYIIDGEGRVFEGRDDRWQGAHAGGDANVGNLGICLLGDFRGHDPSPAALESLRRLIDEYRSTNDIPRDQVVAHQDLKNTECPGKHLASWVRSYSGGRLAASSPLIGTGVRTASAPVSGRATSGSSSVR